MNQPYPGDRPITKNHLSAWCISIACGSLLILGTHFSPQHEEAIRVTTLRWAGTIPVNGEGSDLRTTADVLSTLTNFSSVTVPDDRKSNAKDAGGFLPSEPTEKSPVASLIHEKDGTREGNLKSVRYRTTPSRFTDLHQIEADARKRDYLSKLDPNHVPTMTLVMDDQMLSPEAGVRPAGKAETRQHRSTHKPTDQAPNLVECSTTGIGDTQDNDVLFMVVDDLNDWISLLDADSPIKTPNLERLAGRGVLFTRAYCASPACNPSRSATLTGLRPTTSGVYGNKSDWRHALPERKTIMQRFIDGGFRVRGAGKIFHHHLDGAFHDDASFHDFQHMQTQKYPEKKLNGSPDYGSRNTDWGKWPSREQDTIDFQTADYCIDVLKNHPADTPLFLACGIYKPHSPFFAPSVYHKPYEQIQMPLRRENDWNDLPAGATTLLRSKKWFWRGMMGVEKQRQGSYRDFIRSYAACAAFADAQVGRVLDALDNSPRGDKTTVVLWSDHGFHLGEKDHVEKFALWEKTNHIPLIVVAPGVAKAGVKCTRPVDLTTIYPTLLDLAGLPADPTCDGVSLRPLLEDPKAPWKIPALMTYMRGNHAVRSDRWRYISYSDGTEELYDHDVDPNEWENLASDARYNDVLIQHRTWLPKSEARQVRDLKANLRPLLLK